LLQQLFSLAKAKQGQSILVQIILNNSWIRKVSIVGTSIENVNFLISKRKGNGNLFWKVSESLGKSNINIMIDVKNYKKEAVIQYCKPSKRPMQKYRITFFTNCHRQSRIVSATFLLSQGQARSVNLSSNIFEQQLDTEGINCWDINRKRKFPHFKKERKHHD